MEGNLNKAQKKAAEHKRGPLLLVAGAGAGKTRVITHRIHNLIQSGVNPESILAVTFTNKAAREMRERITELLSRSPKLHRPVTVHALPYVSTFHALCVHILRENARELSISKYFTIFDRADSLRSIKQAMKELGVDSGQIEPRKILGTISRQKGESVELSRYRTKYEGEYYHNLVADVWERYSVILEKEKALDFDDLLLKTVVYIGTNRSAQTKYQNIWRYIHVDEYQDTNKVQNDLIHLLAGEDNNICVVGDIDQTIYTWRGANPLYMLRFEKQYPNTTTIYLEENYRSTKTIIEASNQIIEKNINRPKKILYTNNASGELVSLYGAFDEADEATYITNKASQLLERGVPPKEIAVLYRANFQSRILEELFLQEGIPYQILGVRFFERKEVKDVLSFIRASLNPESISDLKRIVNSPPRGIGKVALLHMAQGTWHTATFAMRKKIEAFYTLLSQIKDVALKQTASQTVRFVVIESGLENHLKSGDEEDKERLENIYELVTLAQKYDHLPRGEGIAELLTDAALATDQDELTRTTNAVKLMTVHAAKGLEFDHVFISGLEDGLFPYEGTDEGRDGEEERRLFYVALTRARKKIFLSFAASRNIFGMQKINIPSEFITDIDESLIEVEGEIRPKEKIIYLDLNG